MADAFIMSSMDNNDEIKNMVFNATDETSITFFKDAHGVYVSPNTWWSVSPTVSDDEVENYLLLIYLDMYIQGYTNSRFRIMGLMRFSDTTVYTLSYETKPSDIKFQMRSSSGNTSLHTKFTNGQAGYPYTNYQIGVIIPILSKWSE